MGNRHLWTLGKLALGVIGAVGIWACTNEGSVCTAGTVGCKTPANGVYWTAVANQEPLEPGSVIAVMTNYAPVEYKVLCYAKDWLGKDATLAPKIPAATGSSDQHLAASVNATLLSYFKVSGASSEAVSQTIANSSMQSASLAELHMSDDSAAIQGCKDAIAAAKAGKLYKGNSVSLVTNVIVGDRATTLSTGANGQLGVEVPDAGSADVGFDAGKNSHTVEPGLLLAIKWTNIPS